MKQNSIELIILGSGTCIPTKERGPSGIVLKVNSEILLFDSGSGTLQKLVNLGIDFRELKYLFYTHSHADHTSDLVPILQALKISPSPDRKDELLILGPPHFTDFLHTLSQAYGEWLLEPDCGLRIQEMNNDRIEFPFGVVTTAPMNHSRGAVGYRLDTMNHKSIVYSGDTDYCTEIIKLTQDADLLILECSFPDDQKMKGHLTPTSAATIAAEAECKYLILTHFYPECEHIDILTICKKIFPREITLARDFMHVSL